MGTNRLDYSLGEQSEMMKTLCMIDTEDCEELRFPTRGLSKDSGIYDGSWLI